MHPSFVHVHPRMGGVARYLLKRKQRRVLATPFQWRKMDERSTRRKAWHDDEDETEINHHKHADGMAEGTFGHARGGPSCIGDDVLRSLTCGETIALGKARTVVQDGPRTPRHVLPRRRLPFASRHFGKSAVASSMGVLPSRCNLEPFRLIGHVITGFSSDSRGIRLLVIRCNMEGWGRRSIWHCTSHHVSRFPSSHVRHTLKKARVVWRIRPRPCRHLRTTFKWARLHPRKECYL